MRKQIDEQPRREQHAYMVFLGPHQERRARRLAEAKRWTVGRTLAGLLAALDAWVPGAAERLLGITDDAPQA